MSLDKHSSHIVRKANVECIVQLQIKLGHDSLAELRAKMSSSQWKLVQIFHDKALRGQGI